MTSPLPPATRARRADNPAARSTFGRRRGAAVDGAPGCAPPHHRPRARPRTPHAQAQCSHRQNAHREGGRRGAHGRIDVRAGSSRRTRDAAAGGTRPATRRSPDRSTSGRQNLTTLAATSSEDGPAGARAHTQPETVGLRATAIVRLKGALAHSGTPEVKSTLVRQFGTAGVQKLRAVRRRAAIAKRDDRDDTTGGAAWSGSQGLTTVRAYPRQGQTGAHSTRCRVEGGTNSTRMLVENAL